MSSFTSPSTARPVGLVLLNIFTDEVHEDVGHLFAFAAVAALKASWRSRGMWMFNRFSSIVGLGFGLMAHRGKWSSLQQVSI